MSDNSFSGGWQDPYPEELIDGKTRRLIPGHINHGVVSGNIGMIFGSYLRKGRPEIVMRRCDVLLTDKNCFIPDVMIVCNRSKIQEDGVHGAPDLVVEVLSPWTEAYDRKHKKAVYEKCGVKEYWLVSPEARSVEQYLLEDGRLTLNEVYAMEPDYMLAKMTEEERAALVTQFKCSLFDDLDIQLEDIFYGMLPG